MQKALFGFWAYLFLLLSPLFSHGQGYRFDKGKTQSITRTPDQAMGFSGTLPTAYSLRKWAPTPEFQDGNSCVGWALSYAAMSITYNKAFGVTDKSLKDILAFDPVFTYAMAKTESENTCDEGVYLPIAIQQMLKYGCKRMIMPPMFMECKESVFEYSDAFSTPFMPEEIYALDLEKATTSVEKIRLLKSMLFSGAPLPFGMETSKSMMGDGNGNPLVGGLWTPLAGDEISGGHAMCLIGYSDSRFGGAFEIMNSWGSGYGDNGFFWIKYADFIKLVEEVIYIEPIAVKSAGCRIGDCYSSYSNMKFPDGGSYEGMMENGAPDGYGMLCWDENNTYAGLWSNGKRHGKGLFFHDGKIYGCRYDYENLIDMEPFGFASGTAISETDEITRHLIDCDHKIEDKIPESVLKEMEEKVPPTKWK